MSLGDKPAKASTMDHIAELAGVAKSTVSRALQGDHRVKPATRERIVALARKHGYAVNSNARKLRQRRSNTIAVVLHMPPGQAPGAETPFILQLLADVANGLWVRRQDLLLCSPESDNPLAYQEMLASKGADGVIFLGQGAGDGWLRRLGRTSAPFVVWGAVDEAANYCAVGSDNVKGGRLVGERFRMLGRQRISFVGNQAHPEMAQRYQGLLDGLGDRRDEVEVRAIEVVDFAFETAFTAVRTRLTEGAPPDAIFAGSDTMAMAAAEAALAAGMKVPDDVTVVGYNDMPMAAYYKPSLTTVRQDTRQAGSLLVEKLFQILDGGRPPSTTLPTELVVRAT